ncbi:NUDIX domain-containing protein [Actinomadura rupiterrae]|uniref:NUDIX domain-containing protein n=1 Tax=Actinomadura rupiterrae TaxID=559627 RepID=UPI0020A2DDA8|nr:NUDIX domain-containing protein [Actinomadura rupiterrae]MCP2343286.1 8-oxo-dGTP diphosphatase [Actinomadura rupiterrae]
MSAPTVNAPDLDLPRLAARAVRDGIGKLVVGAVVHDQGKVLILRRSPTDPFLPGIEELPSGGVDDGESLADALARELAEEIGWDGPLDLDAGFVATFDYLTGSGRRARQFTFGLPSNASAVVLSDEHVGFRWLEPVELDGSDVTPETAGTVRAWAASRHPLP